MMGSSKILALPAKRRGLATGTPRFIDASLRLWRRCVGLVSRGFEGAHRGVMGILFLALLASIVLACATLVYVLLMFRIYPGRPSENKGSPSNTVVSVPETASRKNGQMI
jgi:hypothetical protein